MENTWLRSRSFTLDRALFLFFFICYLLTSSGRICGGDAGTMYQVTHNMLARGTVSVVAEEVRVAAQREAGFLPTRAYTVETAFVSPGVGGLTYSPYGWGQSLAAIPLYALSRLGDTLWSGWEDQLMARMFVQSLNAFFLAALAVVLIEFGRDLGLNPKIAILTGAAFGFGTMVWPYVNTFYSEPATAFCLLCAVYALHRFERTRCRAWAFWAGLSLGCSAVFRITSLIAMPALGIYLGWTLLQQWRAEHRWDALAVVYAVLGGMPGAALVILYNVLRFGHPLALSYTASQIGWDTPVLNGLYGLLFSPGKGLFVYNPILLLGVGGMLLLWARHRGLTLLIGILVVSYVLFHAPYSFWTGGWNWGPRFLIPIIPLLMLPVGFFLQEIRGKAVWLLTGTLIALSVLIQLPAVLVDHSRDMIALSEQYDQFYRKTIDQLEFSPVVRQWPVAVEVLRRFSHAETWTDVQRMLAANRALWFQPGLSDAKVAAGLTAEIEFIRNNVPDSWWVYLYLLRVPWEIVAGLVAMLIGIGGIAAVKICQEAHVSRSLPVY